MCRKLCKHAMQNVRKRVRKIADYAWKRKNDARYDCSPAGHCRRWRPCSLTRRVLVLSEVRAANSNRVAMNPQAEARSRAQEEEEAALAAASVKRAPGPGALSRPASAKPSAAAAAPAAPPCKTCGCNEFTPHPFKVCVYVCVYVCVCVCVCVCVRVRVCGCG
jgi:hypothetical protein